MVRDILLFLCDLFKDYKKRNKEIGGNLCRFPSAVNIMLKFYNCDSFETLNLLLLRSCEMFIYCDVLHETKQKKQTISQECALQTGNHLKNSF